MDTKTTILDIAMNLNRVGNWAADDYDAKKERIRTFLGNTSQYIQTLDQAKLPHSFANAFERFKKEYLVLERAGLKGPKDPIKWAEKMMTWGNILTHRSKLI